MNGPPVLHEVSRCDTNGFLAAKPRVKNSSGRDRASSVTPSLRSNASRITDVYDDPEVAKDDGIKLDSGSSSRKRKQSVIDRVLSWFGLCRQEKLPTMNWQTEKEPDWVSPWVLPVVVLSPRKDTDKVQVKKIGKCTIDTGNTQGNIVSRSFVEHVLEFPKSSIRQLTEAEKEGGSGVTGHRLVPEGAIYLTWYHKKSTRVFHHMRFLISEYPNYDLIIGARSIQEHDIQDVPNLMAASNDLITGGKITIGHRGVKDVEWDKLRQTQVKWNTIRGDLKTALAEAKADEDEDEIKAVNEKLVSCNQQCALADKRLQLCEANRKGNLDLAMTIQDELDELLGQQKLLSGTTTNSTAISKQKEGEKEPQRRTSRKE